MEVQDWNAGESQLLSGAALDTQQGWLCFVFSITGVVKGDVEIYKSAF